MKIKWHGTASVEIIGDEGKILFDPFVPLKYSHINVALSDYDGFSDILITHGHFDHISDIDKIVSRNPNTRVYCTKTPFNTLLNVKKVPVNNLVLIDNNQELLINGFKIYTYHGKHAELPKVSISRIRNGLKTKARRNLIHILRENRKCKENNETVLYVVEENNKKIGIMGSLNLRDDIIYPTNLDALVLPYNAWDDTYSEAVSVIDRIKPKIVYLDHYDETFPPFTTPMNLNPILKLDSVKVLALELNEVVEV